MEIRTKSAPKQPRTIPHHGRRIRLSGETPGHDKIEGEMKRNKAYNLSSVANAVSTSRAPLLIKLDTHSVIYVWSRQCPYYLLSENPTGLIKLGWIIGEVKQEKKPQCRSLSFGNFCLPWTQLEVRKSSLKLYSTVIEDEYYAAS